MSKNLCVDCQQPCFVNRIPTELFDENGNVINDNVYRCQDCENKVDEIAKEFNLREEDID